MNKSLRVSNATQPMARRPRRDRIFLRWATSSVAATWFDAVLMPSATIAPGYGTVLWKPKAGTEYQGVLKQATGHWNSMMGADGKLVVIATSDIKQQRGSMVSLMPEGLQAGLSLQELLISQNIW